MPAQDVTALSGWSEYQTAEEMEINRRYEYGAELRRALGLDVVCGYA